MVQNILRTTERTVIAVIYLDLLLQTAETMDAMANAATYFFFAGVAIWPPPPPHNRNQPPAHLRTIPQRRSPPAADRRVAHERESGGESPFA